MLIQAGTSCKWTNDAQRLLLEHFDTIYSSPSHIYHSALPLSPSSSWLHKQYPTELLKVVRVVKGLPAKWGKCSRTIFLDTRIIALSYWNNIIAVGSIWEVITIFDAITGNQITTFSGHRGAAVTALTFSLDGKSLVSGSNDRTVKLWDMQTGGIVRTFGHTAGVLSVSISPDFTTIASGSNNGLICLWDSQTGECHCVIRQQSLVQYISFSPTDPQHLLSICNDSVWQWDINGHQKGPTFDGSHVTFSLDGILFVACNKTVITVHNSDSGAKVAEFHVVNGNARYCCFSPDNRLVAVAAGNTAYIWNIASSEPCLIEKFIGHMEIITSLVFPSPSSLISVSDDKSVKFWQISTPSTDLVMIDPESTPLASAETRVITLQPEDSIAITSDLNGVVKIWDISTGLCKGSFQTPAKDTCKKDVQLVNGRPILVWCADNKINIWDAEKGELLISVDRVNTQLLDDLKISGDRSRVFSLDATSIQAWSVQTGEFLGKTWINYSGPRVGSLTVDGSRVWAHHTGSGYEGWDFGAPSSLPVQLLNMPPDRPCPYTVVPWITGSFWIEDKVSRKVVFQVPKKYGKLVSMHQNDQYLVACFKPAEVLILDFGCVHGP